MSTQLAAPKKEHRANTQEFLSGKLAQVDIARIEKEIKGLWKSASQTDHDQSGSQESVTRACAMNLILFSEDEDAETVAGDVLDDITSRHPCRAILAISRKAARPSLEAWVSARCHINDSKSRKQICCEQITVRGEGTTHDELASVVLPLILPDLPVFMWWRANNITLSRIKPFVSYLDEIILDSAKHASEGTDGNFFADVLNIVGAHDKARPFQIVVSDLNWRRSLLWREALALSFDHNKGRVPLAALQQIKSVEINYVSNSGTVSNQALLYTGWLSNRLGWQFSGVTKSEGFSKLAFKANGQTVEVTLRGVKCDGSGSDDLCSVQMVFADAKLPQLKVMRDAGVPGVQVRRVSKASENENTSSQNLFRLDQQTESRLMDLELETCDRDGVLEASYRVAADITAELKK